MKEQTTNNNNGFLKICSLKEHNHIKEITARINNKLCGFVASSIPKYYLNVFYLKLTG